MAAALSLLGEINNALNPQPRTLRGQALVETVIGEGCIRPMEPPGQKDWTRPSDGLGSLRCSGRRRES